jgi:hypothetical protein
MIITSEAQAALTPAGNPVAVPMPVAPVVACVIFVNAVLIHSVGVLDAAPAVLAGLTVMVLLRAATLCTGLILYVVVLSPN